MRGRKMSFLLLLPDLMVTLRRVLIVWLLLLLLLLYFPGLFDLCQYGLFRDLVFVFDVELEQIPQDAMRDLFFGELRRRSFLVHVDTLLGFVDAFFHLFLVGLWVRFGQFLGHRVGPGVGKVFGVKDFLQVRQNGHQVVAGWIPRRVGALDVEFARFFVHVRIEDVAGKDNPRPHVGVVVFGRQTEPKLENSVGKGSPPDENDSVKMSQRIHRGDQVNSSGCMGFQVFVFDGDFVIAKSLFALFLGSNWRNCYSCGCFRWR
mmetsp:Transcript_8435/g.18199  ORF Transcript_8435/g.18199 Transcript_8435/m.18199 type:complete len:261 (-) Transcript_8435:130-912(-)